MAFDWKNYLELARSLQKLNVSRAGIQEASHRTAVSRAYYAIYNITLDFAEKNLKYARFLNAEAGRNHGELKRHYFKQDKYKKISRILGRMHDNRILCDYDDSASNIKPLLDDAILSADDALMIITR